MRSVSLSNQDIEKIQGTYFSAVREEIFPLIPQRKFEKSLDVGCGTGSTSAELKKRGISKETFGLEGFAEAASIAKSRLDHVYQLNLDREDLPFKSEKFDLVLCLDVLEHLIDPWAFLEKIKSHMTQEGVLVVSLPNVRNLRVLLPLIFAGKWEYQSQGILDRTHLRFFTKSSATSLIENAGFRIERIDVNGGKFPQKSWFLRVLSLNLLRPFLDFQYLIVAQN